MPIERPVTADGRSVHVVMVECPAGGCDARKGGDRPQDYGSFSWHLLKRHGPGDFGEPLDGFSGGGGGEAEAEAGVGAGV